MRRLRGWPYENLRPSRDSVVDGNSCTESVRYYQQKEDVSLPTPTTSVLCSGSWGIKSDTQANIKGAVPSATNDMKYDCRNLVRRDVGRVTYITYEVFGTIGDIPNRHDDAWDKAYED